MAYDYCTVHYVIIFGCNYNTHNLHINMTEEKKFVKNPLFNCIIVANAGSSASTHFITSVQFQQNEAIIYKKQGIT